MSGPDPFLSAPLNKLGFDPIHNLPSFDTFSKLVLRRAVPIKALLLNQSFSAGVGNWVADEVLYQAKIHPAQYTHTLTAEELESLYAKLKYVCETAVKVEADASKFPKDWLMTYRWNKGKKTGKILPNGLLLDFQTVGGRTSAFAPDIQVLRKGDGTVVKSKVQNGRVTKKKITTIKKESPVKKETAVKNEEDEEPVTQNVTTGLRRSARIKKE